ncbi:unnamed protein product [Fusarium graminearum]|uniref:Secreted protein n=1 Tax=Gibberella zeae TaxID=5518 RepID=A0A9N8WYW7_GIBZA|nr:unnamed protein product [Fusarium graminearum]
MTRGTASIFTPKLWFLSLLSFKWVVIPTTNHRLLLREKDPNSACFVVFALQMSTKNIDMSHRYNNPYRYDSNRIPGLPYNSPKRL